MWWIKDGLIGSSDGTERDSAVVSEAETVAREGTYSCSEVDVGAEE